MTALEKSGRPRRSPKVPVLVGSSIEVEDGHSGPSGLKVTGRSAHPPVLRRQSEIEMSPGSGIGPVLRRLSLPEAPRRYVFLLFRVSVSRLCFGSPFRVDHEPSRGSSADWFRFPGCFEGWLIDDRIRSSRFDPSETAGDCWTACGPDRCPVAGLSSIFGRRVRPAGASGKAGSEV